MGNHQVNALPLYPRLLQTLLHKSGQILGRKLQDTFAFHIEVKILAVFIIHGKCRHHASSSPDFRIMGAFRPGFLAAVENFR